MAKLLITYDLKPDNQYPRLWAALRGNVVFSKLALEHPLVRLTKTTPVFELPPSPCPRSS